MCQDQVFKASRNRVQWSTFLLMFGVLLPFLVTGAHAQSDVSGTHQCDFIVSPEMKNFPLGISDYSQFIAQYPAVIDQMTSHPEFKKNYSELILSSTDLLKNKLMLARLEQERLMTALKKSGIQPAGRTVFDDSADDTPKSVNVDLWPLYEVQKIAENSKITSNAITICMKPGKYSKQITISNLSNLRLLGLSSDSPSSVKIKPDNYNLYGRDPDSKAAITIDRSSNILIENVRLVNKYTFTWTTAEAVHPISRALQIYGSVNVFARNSKIVSRGKQTINTRYSTGIHVDQSIVSCYYFCIASLSSWIQMKNSEFLSNYERVPQDEHSILWNFRSRFIIEDSSFSLTTGRSLVTGAADGLERGDLTQGVVLDGDTRVSGQFTEWLQQNKNYDGLTLSLYGDYPGGISPYFVNSYSGGKGVSHPIGQKIKRHTRGVRRFYSPQLIRTIFVETPTQ